MEVLTEERVTVRKEVRLSVGTIARITTELRALGFGMPSETLWDVGAGYDDRMVQELVERIVSIAPEQVREMCR